MDGKVLGIFGKLHPNYHKNFKLSDVYYGELIMNVLDEAKPSKVKAPVVSKYPSVSRDISLVIKEDINVAELLSSIRKSGRTLIKKCEVFDVYQGEHIDSGYKSVSLNIVYEDKEKTLKSDDVNEIHNKVLSDLITRFEAVQR